VSHARFASVAIPASITTMVPAVAPNCDSMVCSVPASLTLPAKIRLRLGKPLPSLLDEGQG
jgi:hypothetical protein